MNPTDLPELCKPTFLKSNRGENQNLEVNNFESTRNKIDDYWIFSIFLRPSRPVKLYFSFPTFPGSPPAPRLGPI